MLRWDATFALCSRNTSKTGQIVGHKTRTFMCYHITPKNGLAPYALRLESPLSTEGAFSTKGDKMKIMLVEAWPCCAPLRPWRQRTISTEHR